MSALFDENSSSSSSSDDENNKKVEENYEMDFIPKSKISLLLLPIAFNDLFYTLIY